MNNLSFLHFFKGIIKLYYTFSNEYSENPTLFQGKNSGFVTLFLTKDDGFSLPYIRPSHRNHVVGGLLAFLEDVGHAEGVAHLDKPIAESRCQAIVDAVEAALFPRDDVLLLSLSLHVGDVVAANAKTDLRPDAQPRNHRLVFVVFVPFPKIDVEQQRHINVVRLAEITNRGAIGIEAFRGAHALARIDDINLAAYDEMLGDESKAHAASEIGTERGAVDFAHLHGGEGRTEHQAATKTLSHECRQAKHEEQKQKYGSKRFHFH